MPDELTGPAGPVQPAAPAAGPAGTPPAAPPVSASTDPEPAPGGRPPRRPSWLRAALISLVVLAAGAVLGGAAYTAEKSTLSLPDVQRSGDVWHITGHRQREMSGLGLKGAHLIWQDGASIEYLDLDGGKVLLLGPGAAMRTTWDPAISDRYAIWFEAERQASVATQAVVYDTQTGRRWVRGDIGAVYSYPAISGERAVWSSAIQLGQPAVWSAMVVGGEAPAQVAPGYGAPVVSGDLVVWARSWTGPFTAMEIESNTSWRVADGFSTGKLTGLALAGRTLAWGQGSEAEQSGTVAVCGVDGGTTQVVATGVTGLAGPSFDGRTIVWGEKTAGGGRVLARPAAGGATVVVAETKGPVTELAVDGDRVAWIEHGASGYSITVRSLPQ